MTILLDAVATAGDRLVAASSGRIAFDPRVALSRHDDLALQEPGIWSANRHCRMIACCDGWIAVSLARKDDLDVVPAWTGASFDDEPWQAIARSAAFRTAADMVASGAALHLPVARVGEALPLSVSDLRASRKLNGRVLDLSALWAGPYCGGLLAEAGLDVVKIDSLDRPDSTAVYLPKLDKRLNGRKKRRQLPIDAATLGGSISTARVLITSARPHALARLGLTEEALFARNPDLLWIAITSHGWSGDKAMRVGFGDDCAAAGGLVEWEDGEPHFLGDAVADPLTGLTAATLALEALSAEKAGLLDISLAGTSACFAEAIG